MRGGGDLHAVAGGTAAGILNPGEWAYVKFDVDNVAAGKGLTVKFWHEGGHPIVLMKKQVAPGGRACWTTRTC